MIGIAKASVAEREVLFGNAADKAGITNPAIVEKISGFALCWIIFFIILLGHSHLFLKGARVSAKRTM